MSSRAFSRQLLPMVRVTYILLMATSLTDPLWSCSWWRVSEALKTLVTHLRTMHTKRFSIYSKPVFSSTLLALSIVMLLRLLHGNQFSNLLRHATLLSVELCYLFSYPVSNLNRRRRTNHNSYIY